ncbi:C-C motif chemokine 20a.3 [Halichoeres trimaculatus]|uniref:C-C motif chemokine 20a.3 n=1 Tax=Halichoeres trimaculatus TaxID=147232 RepID=UPI003D9E2E9B
MVSTKTTVMVITLLTFCLLVSNTSAVAQSCCLSYAKVKIPYAALTGYTVQTTTVCPINAIISTSQTSPEDRQDNPQLRVTASSTEDDMVSVKAVVMVLTLLTVCLMTSNASAAQPRCCHWYSKTKPAFSEIKGYSVQPNTGMCRINAIIFLLKKGKLVCANPAKDWVMDYINRLRNKAQTIHNISLAKK